jgi:hypothetical protein
MMGLLATVRRYFFDCSLVLEQDALLVPTGFYRTRTARVMYSSIERVWETRLPFTLVLSVATRQGKKFEIVSTMLPDANSYLEIGKFLHAQSLKPKPD